MSEKRTHKELSDIVLNLYLRLHTTVINELYGDNPELPLHKLKKLVVRLRWLYILYLRLVGYTYVELSHLFNISPSPIRDLAIKGALYLPALSKTNRSLHKEVLIVMKETPVNKTTNITDEAILETIKELNCLKDEI